MNKAALVILAALSVSIALADDFKTVEGKEYKNAKMSRVEPDGIVITFSGGIGKIRPGGALEVKLYAISIGAANAKWLKYIISNSAGEVLERKQGHPFVPSNESEFRWSGVDYVKLPAFNDSLRVRVYHELFGNLGDYVIPRNGQPQRLR